MYFSYQKIIKSIKNLKMQNKTKKKEENQHDFQKIK